MDTGSTAWMLASTALVCLMVPGLALFYGGMVAAKSILNMIMMTFGSVALVGCIWVLYGFSASFGDSIGGAGILGDVTEYVGLSGVTADDPDAVIPLAVFAAFQALFAALTAALICGAIADRIKFGAWMAFTGIWVTLVYLPVAHWVFAFDGKDVVGGWIVNRLGTVDFAGGTAVHVNSGAAALAVILVLGRRIGWQKTGGQARPHNLPLVLLGAGLLWFGWFGFNGGSALTSGNAASVAVLNTFTATCSAMLGWLLVEKLRYGRPTSLGAASGAIAGLVAITPSCGAVSPLGALALGAIGGAVCALAVGLKYRFGYDDSLDVVGIHLVGGITGTLLVGVLATADAPNAVDGLLYGGGFSLLGKQAMGAVSVLAYSFCVTWLIAKALDKTMGLRVRPEVEQEGVDVHLHAESAYDLTHAPSAAPVSEPATRG
ncbi:ammonium transporter [Streptomyces sp. BE20]|uniref:ammonium transporter n=1 Tax=unclassified Streptomyces TaxID=2593676 RepID=UPI002E79B6CE|nr:MULTISPECIES: ammonium transporter [unclassified Streptomyces]MED7948804.1 ammonium transporter [Streptomyces sp. BE303]MEE1821292.1 ammonium transporter [Streptomyces sp. BE20]